MKAGFSYLLLVVLPLFCFAIECEAEPKLMPLRLDAEWTVFEGPLLPDGRIDYIKAMNQRDAKTVANDDNAFRALLLLLNTEIMSEKQLKQFQLLCQLLSVTDQELASSPKFDSWFEFAEGRGLALETVLEIEEQVVEGDLSHDQIHVFKQWLNAQQPAFDAAVKACRLSAYWQPQLESSDDVGSGLLELMPMTGPIRAVVRTMKYRTILALSENDATLAADCAIAIRHLSAHQQKGPFIIDAVVGSHAHRVAMDIFRRCINHADPDHEALIKLALGWLETDGRVRYQDIMNADERIYSLNLHMAIAANQVSLDEEHWFLKLDDAHVLEEAIDRVGVDLDALVRRVHMHLKATSQMLDAKTYAEYRELDLAHEKVWEPRKQAFREKYLVKEDEIVRFRLPDKAITSVQLAWVVADLFTALESEFEFDFEVGRPEFANLAHRAVSDSAAACILFYIKHGRYPARLQELVPAYLPALPTDPMDGEPLRYKLANDGSAVIYSIYFDLEDDDGVTDPDDFEALEEGDYCWRLNKF